MNDKLTFGSNDLALPDALREPLRAHLKHLREAYVRRDWAGRVGFGSRPAVVVVDMAKFWLDPAKQIGSNLTPVLNATVEIVDAARKASAPVFFTTFAHDPAHPPCPHDRKLKFTLPDDAADLFEIDPRLQRRPSEKIILKRYASAFKGTNFHEMLSGLGIDTLVVTGISTSHCIYATCRDATNSFRVIVPREAVGERCELMHEVFLLDIDIDLGDVTPLAEVVASLANLQAASR